MRAAKRAEKEEEVDVFEVKLSDILVGEDGMKEVGRCGRVKEKLQQIESGVG